MKTAEINKKLIDSYIALLKNMSTRNKLYLIFRLTKTLKADIEQEKADFYKAFGGWDKSESSSDLIETLSRTRTFNRTIEDF
jgi:hypothetical protein